MMKCTAPGCHFDARYTVHGTDDDGTPYTEHICGCALGYLSECDPTLQVEPLGAGKQSGRETFPAPDGAAIGRKSAKKSG